MNKLASTDKYFTADALDNIDAQTQSMYRNYRKALRAAAKLDTVDAIRAAMPADIRPEQIRIL